MRPLQRFIFDSNLDKLLGSQPRNSTQKQITLLTMLPKSNILENHQDFTNVQNVLKHSVYAFAKKYASKHES